MRYDMATAKHLETIVHFDKGPHEIGADRFFWTEVIISFRTQELGPVVRVLVPIETVETKTIAEIRAEALAGAAQLLNHAALPEVSGFERREPQPEPFD